MTPLTPISINCSLVKDDEVFETPMSDERELEVMRERELKRELEREAAREKENKRKSSVKRKGIVKGRGSCWNRLVGRRDERIGTVTGGEEEGERGTDRGIGDEEEAVAEVESGTGWLGIKEIEEEVFEGGDGAEGVEGGLSKEKHETEQGIGIGEGAITKDSYFSTSLSLFPHCINSISSRSNLKYMTIGDETSLRLLNSALYSNPLLTSITLSQCRITCEGETLQLIYNSVY
jgi:hypothetical protein